MLVSVDSFNANKSKSKQACNPGWDHVKELEKEKKWKTKNNIEKPKGIRYSAGNVNR